MKDRPNNIDSVFKSGLDNFQAEPPADVWASVKEGLFNQAIRDKLYSYESQTPYGSWPIIRAGIADELRPVYSNIAAAVAVLVVVVATAFWAMRTNLNQPAASMLAEQAIVLPAETIDKAPVREIVVPEQSPAGNDNAEALLAENSAGLFPAGQDYKIVARENISEVQANSSSLFTSLRSQSVAANYTGNASGDLSPGPEEEKSLLHMETQKRMGFMGQVNSGDYPGNLVVPEPVQYANKWTVAGNYTPVYSFRYANSENTLKTDNYYYNSETPVISFTSGVSAEYNFEKRWSVRSGIQYSKNGVQVNNVIFYQDVQTGRLLSSGIFNEDIPYPFETSLGNISSGDFTHYIADFKMPGGDYYTGNLSANPEFASYEMMNTDLTQNLEFLEVPVIVKYKLIDRKLGVNLLSGLGASFLINNEVYMTYLGEQFAMGRTSDIRSVNLVGTVGMGLEYLISKSLALNIEPSLKYFLNSMNTESTLSTHPYYFGVYSGISISF